MLCLLSACGGQPKIKERLGQFKWQTGFGGGFVGYCKSGETLWLISVDRAEGFDLSANNGRLNKDQLRHWFVRPNQSDLEHLECQSKAIRLSSAQGLSKRIYGQESTQVGWAQAKPLTDRSMSFPLGSGGILEVSRQGWLIKKNNVVLDWRLKASGLIAATVDGDRIWAIGDRALWRVDLNRSTMVSIALPGQIIKRGLSGLFMDGRVLWLRDKSNSAQPLDIRGHYAYPLSAPGKVNLASEAVKMPIGSGELSWMGPQNQLIFRTRATSTGLIESVDRLLILSAAHVIASSGETLELWYLGGAGPIRHGRFKMPGKTIALFKLGSRIFALGHSYGVMMGAFAD